MKVIDYLLDAWEKAWETDLGYALFLGSLMTFLLLGVFALSFVPIFGEGKDPDLACLNSEQPRRYYATDQICEEYKDGIDEIEFRLRWPFQ